MNERLSFLRYGPGNYFRYHCDGRLELPDGRKSRVTLQVYLNEEGLSGGATRIWDRGKTQYVDVEPKLGRVLIFQQKGLWHSGEEVTKGLKYAMRTDFMFEVGPTDVDGTSREADSGRVVNPISQAKSFGSMLKEIRGKVWTK